MATFKSAYTKTVGIEKGYTVDNGGPTYKGISFKGWGSDPFAKKIFKIVFAAKPKKGAILYNKDLDMLITAFYKANYWDKIYGDKINHQELANFIYDFYINSNSAPAIINNAIGSRGSIGFTESTLAQLNDKPVFCYEAIRKAREQHYIKLAKKPSLKKNKAGWLARLNEFPESISVSGVGSISVDQQTGMFEKLINHELQTLPTNIISLAKSKRPEFKKILAAYIAKKYDYSPASVENYLKDNLSAIGYFKPYQVRKQLPGSNKNTAATYSTISKGIEQIAKQFPDAQLFLQDRKKQAKIVYNNGKGNAIVSWKKHGTPLRSLLINSFT